MRENQAFLEIGTILDNALHMKHLSEMVWLCDDYSIELTGKRLSISNQKFERQKEIYEISLIASCQRLLAKFVVNTVMNGYRLLFNLAMQNRFFPHPCLETNNSVQPAVR